MIKTTDTQWIEVVEVVEKKGILQVLNETSQRSKVIKVISEDKNHKGYYVIPLNGIRRFNGSKWVNKRDLVSEIVGEFEEVEAFVSDKNLEYDGYIPQYQEFGKRKYY